MKRANPRPAFRPLPSVAAFPFAAALVIAGAAAPVGAQEIGPLQAVSSGSPFKGCTADRIDRQPGVNYPETEIEPWIDVNPSNPNNLIAGWQQDRWSNGGARGPVSAYTNDAGGPGFRWFRRR